MALKINEDIIDFINKSDFDKETKEILIAALKLEFKRYKEDINLYSDEYDEILKKHMRWYHDFR